MKRLLVAGCLVLVGGATYLRLSYRWRDERQDRALALAVDWSEIRDATARQGLTPEELLQRLKRSGANTLLVGPSTVRDYLNRDFTFAKRAEADLVLQQLTDRGIAGLRLQATSGKWRIVRSFDDWEPLADLETGFDRQLLKDIQHAGYHLALRVNYDPWLDKAKLFSELHAIATEAHGIAFLLNTDEVPGGPDALVSWHEFLREQNSTLLFFEFHPSKSTLKLAMRIPASTYRAHTIASNELRDLNDAQERARWTRAVQDRACRLLLVHFAPGETPEDFFAHIQGMRQDFEHHGWIIALPKPRQLWDFQPFIKQSLGSVLALVLAIILPLVALRRGLPMSPWNAFFTVIGLTLAGACVMAAVADNPLTRLQIIPFRGIKLAFVGAWVGSLLSLYSWAEIRDQLYRPVRRLDILAGLMAAAIIAYLMIRMGNVGAGWKIGWEQGLRDRLEGWLVVRPRFKEFALGYPLLLLGFHERTRSKSKSFWSDGRFLVALGMIGPISMINTFCHLHSPLYLAFWRSVNGIVLGAFLGAFVVTLSRYDFRKLFKP